MAWLFPCALAKIRLITLQNRRVCQGIRFPRNCEAKMPNGVNSHDLDKDSTRRILLLMAPPRKGRIVGHPEVTHFICRAESPGLATNLPLFLRRLQLPILVTVISVRLRLSRTIQGLKSQPKSCFGRMCLTPEKLPVNEVLLHISEYAITQELHLRCSFLASLFSIGRHVRRHAPRQEFTE